MGSNFHVKLLADNELISLLRDSQDPVVLEAVADEVGDRRLLRSASVLVDRLLGSRVQDDRDVEDAVCHALTMLGLMERRGHLTYFFVESKAANLVPDWDRISAYLPRRYFISR